MPVMTKAEVKARFDSIRAMLLPYLDGYDLLKVD